MPPESALPTEIAVLQFVAPDVFGINLAIFLIVGLVVGGVGTLSGAVIGGLIIIFVPVYLFLFVPMRMVFGGFSSLNSGPRVPLEFTWKGRRLTVVKASWFGLLRQ